MNMAWSPRGKARVCKTLIRGFNSHPGLRNKLNIKKQGDVAVVELVYAQGSIVCIFTM